MSDSAETDELRARLDPVWFNTHWVKNALELYEGVSKHAEELNVNHAHFFGLVQKFALDSAVLGICKLFDRSNPQYQKDTIPELFAYLKIHLTDSYISRLKTETLTRLGVSEHDAGGLATGLRAAFGDTRIIFIDTVKGLMPNVRKDESLKRLLTYRNKTAAHQERIDGSLKEFLKYLPSLDEIERLNKWAMNFCILCISLLTPNIVIMPSGRSARMAALNVAAKLLDKKFTSFAEREAFFSRI